ncbi:ATP-binding cassette domain-containing protein [Fluviispira multicolorata]|uniref:Multidrug resistance-like ATP-binding protein MdlB n=1 Tax=Fluviispira multicolorata TaxID=2654512 RepID=A0A833N4A7_9BACT|nr:ATP-binding cassette domain-containing protein [Fluviispira multicolorata]KAB8030636.1 ATP-binding cassette domain-containing protein [Fluviispira multicolorata]
MELLKNLFFLYLTPVFKKILNKDSNWTETDVPTLAPVFSDKYLNEFERKLNYKSKMHLAKSFLDRTKKQILLLITLMLLRVLFSLLSFFALYYFINQIMYFKNIHSAILSSLLMTSSIFFNGIITAQYFKKNYRFQYFTKYFFARYIFKKIPKLYREEFNEALIINNSTSDIEEFSTMIFSFFEFIHDLLISLGCLILLFYYLGISAFFAIGILLIFIPLIKWVVSKTTKKDEEIQEEKDNRIQILNSLFSQIRNIKSYLLEKYFHNKIIEIRNRELNKFKVNTKYYAFTYKLISILQSILCISTLACFLALGHELTLPVLFTCLGLFKTLESSIFESFEFIQIYSSGKASLNRLFNLIKNSKEEELTENNLKKDHENCIKINTKNPNFNLSFKKGEKVAIIGKIGSGKSLLLEIMSGFKTIKKGKILLQDNPLFIKQTPWIMNASIRENISLGNSNLNLDKFIHAANLEDDIKLLKNGVETLIGENGVNLSGGQKQRIALARAATMNTEIILLDDPLSALDMQTAEKIVNRLFCELWKEKSLIIATHNLNYIHLFDRIILLDKCNILADGNFNDLINFSSNFIDFYQKAHNSSELNKVIQNDKKKIPQGFNVNDELEIENLKNSFKTYLFYLRAILQTKKLYGIFYLIIFLILFIGTAFLPKFQDIWLSFWSSKNLSIMNFNFINNFSNMSNILIYSLFGLLSALSIALLTFLWSYRGVYVSELLNIKSLNKLLFSPLKSIDTLTTGRVISCFSHDISILDSKLPKYFQKFLCVIFEMIFFLISLFLIKPIIILLIFPIILLQYKILKLYIHSSRALNRKIAIPRASRINNIRESYQGQNILSALNMQEWFFSKYILNLQEEVRMEILEADIDMWHCFMCFLNNALLILIISLIGIFLIHVGSISAPILSLITTWIMIDILHFVFNFSHSFSNVEQGLVSLERVEEFSYEKVGVSENKSKIISSNKEGSFIEFKNVYMQYENQERYVLNNFSTSINFGETIGIVGKTGSGKSSILSLLLKFYDYSHGQIFFNGKGIETYSTQEIRQQISIVLQNPQFFPGSIRYNLDPHDKCKDEMIFSLLSELNILEMINSFPEGIHTNVLSEKFLLSVGQRQILSFARALLKPAKVLLLDEATANIDIKSEQIILKKLKDLKGTITIIIIAHRTDILASADRVISI